MIYTSFLGFKSILGSTHVVEQLSLAMLSLTMTFNFDLTLGSFFTVSASYGLILGSG